jgi:hypothetical protein
MTASPMQVAANRCNGLKSRGPRTVLGKQKSSQNARRHGLSIQTAVTREVQQLARAILMTLPMAARTAILDNWAHLVAQAEFDIERARAAKRNAYRQLPLDQPYSLSELGELAELRPSSAEITRAVEEIRRIERYEARALARWRKAVRYFRIHEKETLARMNNETRVGSTTS